MYAEVRGLIETVHVLAALCGSARLCKTNFNGCNLFMISLRCGVLNGAFWDISFMPTANQTTAVVDAVLGRSCPEFDEQCTGF